MVVLDENVLLTTESQYLEDGTEVGSDWESEKSYFMEFLEAEIKHYEAVHRTQVSHVCLAGTVGRWNGRFTGGKHLPFDSNPLDCLGNIYDVTVSIDEQRVIDIRCTHHDGTHVMNIYIISDSLYERWDRNGRFDTPEFYAWLIENRRPVRLRKANKFYNI